MNFRTTVGVVDSLRRNPLHGTNSCAALDVFPPPERRRAIGKERGMGHRRSCRSCAGTRWPKTACDRPLADPLRRGLDEQVGSGLPEMDALLHGRRTYDTSASYWTR